jgi:hypothetical protein
VRINFIAYKVKLGKGAFAVTASGDPARKGGDLVCVPDALAKIEPG